MFYKSHIFLLAVALCLICTTAVMAAGPVGHFLFGKQLISNSSRCQVGPELREILKNPDAQRAFAGGAIGPDICEDQSHYKETASLAQNMLNDALSRYRAATVSKDEASISRARKELGFAYGWYTHCAADLNVHPKVNAAAGDTYRYNNSAQKTIHAAQEAQLTAYLKSIVGNEKYDVYVPFDFLAKHVGVSADNLRASEAKLRAKVVAELFASSKVKMTDQIRESWRAAVTGSMRDAESFLRNPGAMQNWDLDCGRISTADFEELRKLAIEANGGKLPAEWGKQYMPWYEKTKGMSRAEKLTALKALIGKKTIAKTNAAAVKKSSAPKKRTWAWVLTNTIEYNPLAEKPEAAYSISGSGGSYTLTWKSSGCYVQGCPGEAFSVKYTCSKPPAIIKPNETIELTISGSITENTIQHYGCNTSMDVFFDRIDIDPGSYGGGPGLGGIKLGGKTDKSAGNISQPVKSSPGRGYESTGKMALIVAMYNGRNAGTKYIYEWKLTGN